jgi:hypothetical protein
LGVAHLADAAIYATEQRGEFPQRLTSKLPHNQAVHEEPGDVADDPVLFSEGEALIGSFWV